MVRSCSGRSARCGGQGESEDTDEILDRVVIQTNLGCWRGGQLRSWESLVITELLVIDCGGAGNSGLWCSWDSSAGAELGFVGGG